MWCDVVMLSVDVVREIRVKMDDGDRDGGRRRGLMMVRLDDDGSC